MHARLTAPARRPSPSHISPHDLPNCLPSTYRTVYPQVEACEEDATARCYFYAGKVPLRRDLPELHAEVVDSDGSPRAALGGCFGPQVRRT